MSALDEARAVLRMYSIPPIGPAAEIGYALRALVAECENAEAVAAELPDVIRGYTPTESFEVRVRRATDAVCAFDPDAAESRMRTEAWVRLALRLDEEGEGV